MIGSDNNDNRRARMIEIRLCSLRHTPMRGKVEVDVRFPICIRGFFNALEKITPGIRYDNIETAQLRRRPMYKRTGCVRISDIQRLVESASSMTFHSYDKTLRAFTCSCFQTSARDVAASLCKNVCDACANAAADTR